jgi:two-component system sensor histidine kinase KdpD
VIRSAKRLAVSLHAEWVAAFVETPRLRRIDEGEREQLLKNTKLAERLGAETVTLSGLNVVEELVNYARTRNVTKIVAGKPDRPWWIDLLFRSQVDQLLRKSGEIDVYVVRGIGGDEREAAAPASRTVHPREFSLAPYAWSALAVTICTLAAGALDWRRFELSNLIMIYLVGVVAVSARYGRGPSSFAAVLSVLTFDFFFVPPRFTFAVADSQYLLTFGVMLGVALLIGTLTVRIRDQAEASRERERRTESLYRMTQQLAGTRGLSGLSEMAVRQLGDVFHCHVVLLTPDLGSDAKQLTVRSSIDAHNMLTAPERAVAQWVFEHLQQAGAGTDTLPSSAALYLPLVASRGAIGVVGLASEHVADLLWSAQRPLLDAFLDQIALAIERDGLADQARQAQVQAEAESLRSSLLSSVSHDLRTPLAIITSASSSLIEASTNTGGRGKSRR